MATSEVIASQEMPPVRAKQTDNFSARIAAVWGLAAGLTIALCAAAWPLAHYGFKPKTIVGILSLLTGFLLAGGLEYVSFIRVHVVCKTILDFFRLVFTSALVGAFLPLLTLVGFAAAFATIYKLSRERKGQTDKNAQTIAAYRDRFTAHFVPGSLVLW